MERPAAELVPGDVVLLSAGDLVPARGDITDARDLYANEALLTGESDPAEKHAGADGSAGRFFMANSVVSGTATMILTATGRNAQLGTIASTLRRPPPPTAFILGIRDFGPMIMWLTLLLVLFTLLINLIFHCPALQSFPFAIALAVGLTPELLPMVVLYDLSEIAIPLDNVDASTLATPHRRNIAVIRRFMFLLGPVSCAFDFITFSIFVRLLGANETLFHIGWFVESLATQVLVIFIIRTTHPLRSFAHPLLAAALLGTDRVAFLLPYLSDCPLARFCGPAATRIGRNSGCDSYISCPRVFCPAPFFARRLPE